jgi:hypothetical protein
MSMLTVLKSGGRAAAIAAMLAVPAAIVAAPAQAAPPPPPNISFSMHFGNGYGGPGMFFNYGNGPTKKKLCLSDKQIYWQLQDYGFNKIKIVKNKGYKVIVVARYHHDWYQLVVDRCTGKIRKAPLHYFGNGNGPSSQFGITLSF